MNKITIAGNIIVDIIKIIDSYPEESMLSSILSTSESVGGCAPNTLISIAKMKGDIHLSALGRVGSDSHGQYVLQEMKNHGIDVEKVLIDDARPTSYTDVMTVKKTGKRTFFQNRGANAFFSIDDVDVENLNCDMFHIGYLLLLDSFDADDAEYGTPMARLLHSIQKKGIKTSIDVVSENGDRFKKVVTPAVQYCNYIIINEVEAGRITEINPRNQNNEIDIDAIKKILSSLIQLGVKDLAVIHAAEGGYAMNAQMEFFSVPAADLPENYIAGGVGAGDSFCAGVLYGIAKNYSIEKMLEYANLAAAANLSQPDSVSGLRPEAEIWKLKDAFYKE